jgi:hypothetical protein
VKALGIVFRKEMREILRDRRTLIAIGLAALATPIVLIVISQVTAKTATQTYTVGYSGDIPVGLDTLLTATALKLERVSDPAAAAKKEVDLGVVFQPTQIDEYYDPSRQSAQIADTRLQTVLGQYDAAKAAAALREKGIDPALLNPVPLKVHPLSSPVKAAGNAFLSFFLPYILITMVFTGGLSAALDATAGEREKKTLEALLLTPSPRSRILLDAADAVATTSARDTCDPEPARGGRHGVARHPAGCIVQLTDPRAGDTGQELPARPGLFDPPVLHHHLPSLDHPVHPKLQPEPGLLPDPDLQRGARPAGRDRPELGRLAGAGRHHRQPCRDSVDLLVCDAPPFHP